MPNNLIADILLQTTKLLKPVSETPELEAELITAYVLKINRSKLLASLRDSLNPQQAKQISELTSERLTGIPLAYLHRTTWFFGREFKVTNDVLIPRPETEGLVELALNWAKNKAKTTLKVLEVGTGSGCIAITLAAENNNLNIISIDISEAALKVALENSKKLIPNVTNIEFTHQDVFSFQPSGKYDIIISNPPYIPALSYLSLQKSVKDFEPKLALVGGIDGQKYYRRLFELVNTNLNEGGFACFELDAENYEKTKTLAEEIAGNLEEIKILPDLAGRIRYLTINRS